MLSQEFLSHFPPEFKNCILCLESFFACFSEKKGKLSDKNQSFVVLNFACARKAGLAAKDKQKHEKTYKITQFIYLTSLGVGAQRENHSSRLPLISHCHLNNLS